MEINFFDPPKRDEQSLHDIYFAKNFVLEMEDVLSSKGVYVNIFQDILDILKYGFERKEIRTHPIKIRFHKSDKKTHTFQIRHLLTNLIMWKFFIDIDKVDLLDENFIFDAANYSTDSLKEYIDEKILPIHDGDYRSKNAMVDDICHACVAIAHGFSLLIGMSFSVYDMIEMEKRHPEIIELTNGELDTSMAPDELEHELDRRVDRFTELVISDRGNNDLKPLLICKDVRKGQLREFIISVGFNSDISGNTIPVLINTNFFKGGLTKASHIYANACGGRKALMLTKLGMGEPGAFAKKLTTVSTSPGILGVEECCDSIGYIEYHIRDDTFLSLLDGRTYYDERGTMKILDYKKDKHLIGKIVPFRSPATCMGHDGICKACYGHLYDLNIDLFSVGAIAALKLSEPWGQTVLSSKHQQSTASSEIAFSEGFYQAFELTSNEVTLKSDSDMDADLSIILGDVHVEEMDDSDFYYMTEFDLVDNSDGTVYHIEEDNKAKMYLNDQLVRVYKKLKDKKTAISLENMDEETALVTIEVTNKELTEPLRIFRRILNMNDHYGANTLSEVCQVFADNLIMTGSRYYLTNAECIIRALVRRVSDNTKFPDFTRAGDPRDVDVLKLDSALLYNPSALVSMSFGYLRRLILSSSLYSRNAPSHIDALAVPRLSQYIG